MNPIELFYWPTPNGWKATIALEEMQIPYVLRRIDITQGAQNLPAFRTLSPGGKMPVIIDPRGPDGAPISVFESAAILQYLGRKSGLLYPREERTRSAVDQWMIWQAANLGPIAAQAGFFRDVAPALVDDPAALAFGAGKYTQDLATLYGVLDRRLEDRDYLVGEYSLADIMCWPGITRYAVYGQSMADFPHLRAWLARIASRPAVKRGAFAGYEWDPLHQGMTDEAYRLLTGRTQDSAASPARTRDAQFAFEGEAP